MMKNYDELWLDYRKISRQENDYFNYLKLENINKNSTIIKNALDELRVGLERMLSVCYEEVDSSEKGTFIIRIRPLKMLTEEGFHIWEKDILYLEANSERGILYGIFELLGLLSLEKELKGINLLKNPHMPLRMLNHWDNMNGSIERGYSGNSFFFENDEIIINSRTKDYARLMSSIGINAVVINNVNVMGEAKKLITEKHIKKLAQMSEILGSYGIKMFLCLNYMSPVDIGGLDSADPYDADVKLWWDKTMKFLFKNIGELGGFLIKADSEGRPGPYLYGRTQADGANMLAQAVRPYNGIIIWRCFVYNNMQDWRDYKTDRAKASYDNFIHTDGSYLDNVILQIKNGPMDFQIREPISPLLGSMKQTNQMLEIQLAQEYTGHQIDLCYLIPLIKEALDFHTFYGEKDTIADVISGSAYGNKNAGIAAVSNTGNDKCWTGNPLAALNLYGYGKLAFDSRLSSDEIAEEWIRRSLTNEESAVNLIKEIVLDSRAVYEKYTSPLGIGWMVMPGEHYGCCVDGYEYARFGTYHRADHLGIGVDRTNKGTGYVKQYHEINCKKYDDINTCPEELLLFFHHVPYTYVLRSGKTVIQHIYDSHFEGVKDVEYMKELWSKVKDYIDDSTWMLVEECFKRQLDNAIEWRDQINSYFYRKSGIADEHGRKIY